MHDFVQVGEKSLSFSFSILFHKSQDPSQSSCEPLKKHTDEVK